MDLNKIYLQAEKEIKQGDIEAVRVKYLGRKGLLNQLLDELKNLPAEEKKEFGQNLNELKIKLTKLLGQKSVKTQEIKLSRAASLEKVGHFHPLTLTENEINELFRKLGFSIYEGPEIETDEYNFRRLNVPKNHPARDMQDTIYIKEPEILLRTQGSAIETHLLQNEKPPFRTAFPGIVYRNETVTKSNHFIFHQYQGVVVDRDVSLKNLIGVFNLMFKHLYGDGVVVRYRCKYYPEVEPGLGLDLQCFKCQGKGCSLCKGAGWIEMGGAGIIHPEVLTMAGIDPKIWRGFAFGLGLDRWTMARYKINDIRTLTGGNLAYIPFKQ